MSSNEDVVDLRPVATVNLVQSYIDVGLDAGTSYPFGVTPGEVQSYPKNDCPSRGCGRGPGQK